jgi:P-type Cu2+ transporter
MASSSQPVHTDNNGDHAGHNPHTPNNHDQQHDHNDHAGHTPEQFRRPFWTALILTIPVLIYAEHVQMLLGYTPPPFPGAQYVGAVLGSIIYWYGGWVFLCGAASELRERRPGMMTLVALAISTAYFYSLAVTFRLVSGLDFYWELATLVTIMLLGHWLEMRAVGRAQSALGELAKLLPDTAERLTDAGSETVPVTALRDGDLVLVRPGAAVPSDGLVEQGTSQVNEAMLTDARLQARKPRSFTRGMKRSALAA